jgi:hexosaminidase
VKPAPGNKTFSLPATLEVSFEYNKDDQQVLFDYLEKELATRGVTLVMAEKNAHCPLRFLVRRMPTGGDMAYRLFVKEDGITIESNFDVAAFYGIQTLLQLMQPVTGVVKEKGKGFMEIPLVEIFDTPRFGYRGMHLDVGRHFFPVTFIKKFIDYLAHYKINNFHWHLTEDQGWRVEIQRYPLLTRIGGWRNGTIIGRYPGQGSDETRYGGYYTKAEIREVVAYATSRFVNVIPEMDIPGHTSAAIAAYPYLSCFPSKPTEIPANMISRQSIREQQAGRIKLVQETWGVFDDVLCAGNDSTFVFLEGVIDELVELFPSKYFHMGGDECPKTHWKACPKCQSRMRALGLKDEHELQSYFIQRVEKYLNKKGKTLIGWDEILEGGLAPNAVVMSWRGEKGGIDAARQKHYVIMSPQNPVYFDHTQSENEDSVTIGGYNPIEKVYAWNPEPAELSAQEKRYILGAQANVWTEYIKNPHKVEYTIFPRIAALSEVLWTVPANKNWAHFQERLPSQFEKFRAWGAHFSTAYFEPKATVMPTENNKGVYWKIEGKTMADTILFHDYANADPDCVRRESGRMPDTVSLIHLQRLPYTKKILCDGDYGYKIMKSGLETPLIMQSFSLNKASGKKITLTKQASSNYPGDGAFTLVNGIVNQKGFARTKEFLGWSGEDCEAVIDLGAPTELTLVTTHALKRRSSWIWEPAGMELQVSADGDRWTRIGFTDQLQENANGKVQLSISFDKTTTRYLKVQLRNHGKIAEKNPGAGRNAWLFVDEIQAF